MKRFQGLRFRNKELTKSNLIKPVGLVWFGLVYVTNRNSVGHTDLASYHMSVAIMDLDRGPGP